MKSINSLLLALASGTILYATAARADNPLIMDQFTADPTARLFEGKIFLYASHDMPTARSARGGQGWFAMEDYHVFSTENLLDWKDYGVIVDQKQVPWIRGAANSMWAPDCVLKDGKYYFYFPASNSVGVAIAEKPEGPYKIETQPVARGIDPCCFIDPKDGKSYLVWAGGGITISKLKDNMKELEGETIRPPLPGPGLIEGPFFMFERKGIYYLTYPHAVRTAGYEAECLEYATGASPMGPFTYKGLIMDQSPPPNIITQEMKDLKINPGACWTNHHSFVEYKGQWILFYHDKDLSPEFDKDRAVRADYLSFNDDGSIQKVIPTLRGVGVCDAKRQIQVDRYSAVSKEGTALAFLDEKKRVLGWKIALTENDAFTQYDRVDFAKHALTSVKVRANSSTGGTLEIRLDKPDGPVLAKVEIAKGTDWQEVSTKLSSVPSDLHNLVVRLVEKNSVEVDWISFE